MKSQLSTLNQQPTPGRKLGIDATKKLLGEGSKRPWPPLIKVDESVRKKVNSLRCLLVIDLKTEPLTHAAAGQMHLQLNYAREHWTRPGENPPVGLMLCSEKDHAVARYALAGLDHKILSAEYRLALPSEKALTAELEQTRRALELRRAMPSKLRRAKRLKR